MSFLKGKTAIITGAGKAVLTNGECGSIGYGIATAYAKEGANLVLTGRNLKKLEDAKVELEAKYGIQVVVVQAYIVLLQSSKVFLQALPCLCNTQYIEIQDNLNIVSA